MKTYFPDCIDVAWANMGGAADLGDDDTKHAVARLLDVLPSSNESCVKKS